MALFESEASTAPPASDARPSPRRLPRWFFPYAAVVAIGIGVAIHVRTESVVVTCEREAGASPGCGLERHVLFGAISTNSERVTGVQRARTVVRSTLRQRPGKETFVVVLDTAEGERDAGWSSVGEPAYALTNAINGRIHSGVPRFAETLHPHAFDVMIQLFGLFWIILGLGLAVWPVVRGRRRGPAPGEEGADISSVLRP